MLVYDLAMVDDHGSHYKVVGVQSSEVDKSADQQYLRLSAMAAKMIRDANDKGVESRLPKTLQTVEVLPGEVTLVEVDPNDVESIRTTSLMKVRTIVVPEMTKESGFTLYNFIMNNNELASQGYFITNSNREEKYIEIIETGNEKLIETLESYLESKDLLERAASLKVKLDKYRKEISRLTTAEEIKAQEEQFLTDFYAIK